MLNKIFYLIICTLFLVSNTSFALTLDNIYNDLYKHYPQYKGITYDVPSWNNQIEENNWFLQTPNSWNATLATYNSGFQPKKGQKIDETFFVPTCQTQDDCSGVSVCKVLEFNYTFPKSQPLCLTKAHDFLEEIYTSIVSADYSVDISTLGMFGPSTKAFTAVLKKALWSLAIKSLVHERPIVVRIIEGSYLPVGSIVIQNFLDEVLYEINTVRRHRLIIAVADVRSCTLKANCGNEDAKGDLALSFAWNHSKIINIDNKTMITGGENYFGADYLEKNPVNDLNIKIQGDVVNGATIFADLMWKYVDSNPSFLTNICLMYKDGKTSRKCLTNIDDYIVPRKPPRYAPAAPVNALKSVNAMYISKLNNGVDVGNDADQSELARVYAFLHAEKSIKISQQAFYFMSLNLTGLNSFLHPSNTVDGDLIHAIAYAMTTNHVNIDIVTGNLGSGKYVGYSSNTDLKYLYDCFLETLQKDFHFNAIEAEELLKSYLHLSTLGYLPDKSWDDFDKNVKLQNRSHNKFWMVDDKIFYVGSHNFYPTSVQDFGVIVEAPEDVIQYVLDTYWQPMWYDSRKY